MSSAEIEVSESAAQAQRQRLMLLVSMVGGHAIKHIFSAGFFIVLPELKAGLGLSNASIGAISTVRSIGGGLANFPAGYLADRYRHRFASVLALTMVLIGASQFALGRAVSYWQVLLLAMLVVMITNFWHPAAIGSLSRVFSNRRGLAIALHGTGGSIGETLGPLVAGALLLALSWRTVFEVSLIPAVIAGVLVWLMVRSFPIEPGPQRTTGYLRLVHDLLRDRRLLAILFVAGGYAATLSAISTFLPVYIREDLGHSTWVVGAYVSLAQAVGIGAQPLMGHLSDLWGRKRVLVFSLFGLGLSALTLYVVASGVLFILTLAIMGAFLFSILSLLLAAGADMVTYEVQSTMVSLVYSAATLFSGVSPLLGGLVADAFGVRSVFLFASTLALATAAFALAWRWQGSRIAA